MPPRPRSRRHFYFPMADTPSPPQRWQKLRTEPHATTRIFDVTRVIYRHPLRGGEQDFVVINAPDWVNVIALTPEHHLVLVRQFRYGTDTFSLEIPGGVIDPGEEPIAAGVRAPGRDCWAACTRIPRCRAIAATWCWWKTRGRRQNSTGIRTRSSKS